MELALLELLAGRRGHFQMESGYHSECWFDLDRLLAQRERLAPFVSELARRLAAHPVEVICGPMTGGAHLAQHIATELKLTYLYTERIVPTATNGLFPVRYQVPMDRRESVRGQAVAIVDDAISAGSAVRGTFTDLVDCGARPVVLGALFVFGEAARRFATEKHVGLESIARASFGMWPPADCPLCRAGTPVERVTDVP
jgi:orotate phosphoribosyltransferase